MGRRGLEQRRLIGIGDVADRFHGGQVARHHGEWLVAAPLARAQAGHRRRVARVAGQVESAQSLDGQDFAGGEPAARLLDRRGEDPFRNGCGNRSLTVAARMRFQSRDRQGAVAGD